MQNKSEALTARGYRRVSNRYRIIARIDRPDWVSVLAAHLRRAPADFYAPGAEKPSGNWADYYRRVLSKDSMEVSGVVFKKIPGSGWDDTGFIAPPAAEDASEEA